MSSRTSIYCISSVKVDERVYVTEGTDYDWQGGGGDSRHKGIGIGRRRYGS
jgi:hypothetical protein